MSLALREAEYSWTPARFLCSLCVLRARTFVLRGIVYAVRWRHPRVCVAAVDAAWLTAPQIPRGHARACC